MVLKTDENGDEYFNYYDISEVQDDTLKFLSDFVDNFLHTIVLQCLIIGLVFFIFLVLLWIFSHDVCIPCVACFNSKGAWLYNIILCLTCGLLRKPAFRIVERYCKRDGIFLQYNDYKEKIRQFDEMAKLVDEGDKGLIDKVLQSYKFKYDPYRIVTERETRIKIKEEEKMKAKEKEKEKEKEKVKEKTKEKEKNTGILAGIVTKVKTTLASKFRGKVTKRVKKKRVKKK
ncbi:uncharacterized protein LOC107364569 [Tetranychus urticae]|uniref:uncharacterized protein LOC107364569 n=1 Tax=Tetranychus urticae TaxID=32264 RepID=UPI00077BFFEA|nr:uncharacterized protein LOC107364569 [Tetranychus urticae]